MIPGKTYTNGKGKVKVIIVFENYVVYRGTRAAPAIAYIKDFMKEFKIMDEE